MSLHSHLGLDLGLQEVVLEGDVLSGGVPNFALMAVERDRWALLVDGERGFARVVADD